MKLVEKIARGLAGREEAEQVRVLMEHYKDALDDIDTLHTERKRLEDELEELRAELVQVWLERDDLSDQLEALEAE